jgi:ComF family protein
MKNLLLKVLGFIFPITCSLCKAPINSTSKKRICESCDDKLPKIKFKTCQKCGKKVLPDETFCKTCNGEPELYSFDKAWAVYLYKDDIKKLIYKFKYSNRFFLSQFFAKKMQEAMPQDICFDTITAVPISLTRRIGRGYNQASLLAKHLSVLLKKPYADKILFRKKITKPQFGLSKKEREKNINNAFIAIKSGLIENKTVLLIDDIFTTGTTVSACSAVLKKAGAAQVFVLSIARR